MVSRTTPGRGGQNDESSARSRQAHSNVENILLFGGDGLIHLLDGVLDGLFDPLFGAFDLVRARFAAVLERRQEVESVVTSLADGNLALFPIFAGDLHELFAALLGERRQRDPDDVALDLRAEPEVAFAKSLLHELDLTLVPRFDDEQPGLGHVDVRHLGERRGRPVVVHPDPVEQGGVRATCPELRKVSLQRLVRLRYRAPQLFLDVLNHGLSPGPEPSTAPRNRVPGVLSRLDSWPPRGRALGLYLR